MVTQGREFESGLPGATGNRLMIERKLDQGVAKRLPAVPAEGGRQAALLPRKTNANGAEYFLSTYRSSGHIVTVRSNLTAPKIGGSTRGHCALLYSAQIWYRPDGWAQSIFKP